MFKLPTKIKRGVIKSLTYILMSTPLLLNCTKDEFEDLEIIEPEIVISENVKILSQSELENISRIDPSGTITFEEASNYSRGNILVAGISDETPGGLLKKIENISSDGKTANTINAALDEAIEKGNFSFSKDFEVSDFEDTKMIKGVSQVGDDFTYEFNEVLIDLDGNLSTIGDQIKINGKISFDINTYVDAGFNWGNVEFLFETKIKEESSLEAIANMNNMNFDKEVLVFSASGIPFQIPFAPIPLFARPEFELYLGAKGEVDANVNTKLENYFYFEGGIYYQDKMWSLKKDLSNEFIFYEPEVSVKGEITAYCKPKLNLIINEIAGPSAGVKGYLKMEIDNEEDPWWELYGGLDVVLGISSGWLTNSFGDYERTILEFEEKVADSGESDNLEAKLIASPEEGFVPLEVLFDASSSTGDIKEYYFEFGDGNNILEIQGEENFDGKVEYIYENFGNYNPQVTIKNISGKTDSKSLEILVQENLPPVANFEIFPSERYEDTIFTFDASSSYDNEDNFEDLFFRWDFEGDGNWESEWGKEYIKDHQYEFPGEYGADLEVKDSKGLISRFSRNVGVLENNEMIELKNDDGTSEFSEWFDGTCPEKWWGEGYVFKKYFDCQDYNLKLKKIKFKVDSKSSNNSNLYISFLDEENNDLIPDIYVSKVLIDQSEINLSGWTEKDISSYNVEIEGGKLHIGISENLSENCNSVESIYGTKIAVDENSKGNSIMYSIKTAYDFYTYVNERKVDGEFMIRIEAEIENP